MVETLLESNYPREFIDSGIEGLIVARFIVEAEGTPSSVTVSRSSMHPRLDQAAMTVVRGKRFAPARVNGAPVRVRVEIPARFGLQGEDQ